MKKLLFAAASVIALSTSSYGGSNEIDKGVASALFYSKKCNATLPPKVAAFIKVWVNNRGYEVADGLAYWQSKLNDLASQNSSMNLKIATELWCSMMKPDTEKRLREMEDAG